METLQYLKHWQQADSSALSTGISHLCLIITPGKSNQDSSDATTSWHKGKRVGCNRSFYLCSPSWSIILTRHLQPPEKERKHCTTSNRAKIWLKDLSQSRRYPSLQAGICGPVQGLGRCSTKPGLTVTGLLYLCDSTSDFHPIWGNDLFLSPDLSVGNRQPPDEGTQLSSAEVVHYTLPCQWKWLKPNNKVYMNPNNLVKEAETIIGAADFYGRGIYLISTWDVFSWSCCPVVGLFHLFLLRQSRSVCAWSSTAPPLLLVRR